MKQLGRCEICQRDGWVDVDHDHVSGKVRGLLCRGCNVSLGFYERPTFGEVESRPAMDAYLANAQRINA